MAKAIASRLLHEPTLRMKRSAGSDEAYLYVSALRELFGLDAETEPEGEAPGKVTELRRGAITVGVPLNASMGLSGQGFHLTFFEDSCQPSEVAVAKKVQDVPALPG